MHRPLAAALALTAGAMLAAPARAQVYDPNVSVSTSLTTVAQSATVSVLDLGTSGKNGLVSNQAVDFGSGDTAGTISYTGTSGIYSGNVTGVTAAPYTATGPTTGNYFAAEPKSAITFSYAQQQQYFGMMWGSVDSYNTLSFYRGDTLVEQLPGKAITAVPNGVQGAGNTYWVNVNFGTGVSFDRVVATSTSPAFEFSVIAFSTTTQAITPAQVAAAGNVGTPQSVAVNAAPVGASPLVVLLLGALRRRRQRAG
ncbi:MAG: hypothetical protein ACOYOH_09560 [Paracraurococcus sp.]